MMVSKPALSLFCEITLSRAHTSNVNHACTYVTDADDAKDEQGENDTNTNPSVSNGFLWRSKPACRDNVSTPLTDEVATAKDHARHLISQRNFEDILQ